MLVMFHSLNMIVLSRATEVLASYLLVLASQPLHCYSTELLQICFLKVKRTDLTPQL